MNKKILVIFLFAIIILILIYKYSKKDDYILVVGEENIDFDNNNYKINTFLYDNITYKELINSIRTNDYIIVKGRKIYLNELIYKSKYIIITANKKSCEKNSSLNDRNNMYLSNLIYEIKRINVGEIIVIKYCNNINIDNNIKIIDVDSIDDLLDNT